MRRSGCSAPVELMRSQRIGAEPVRARRALETVPDDQKYRANAGEQDQQPPCGPIDIVQAPCGNREARQKRGQIEDAVERRYAAVEAKNCAVERQGEQ